MKLATIIPKKIRLEKGVVVISNKKTLIIDRIVTQNILHCKYIREDMAIESDIIVLYVTDVERVIGDFSDYKKVQNRDF